MKNPTVLNGFYYYLLATHRGTMWKSQDPFRPSQNTAAATLWLDLAVVFDVAWWISQWLVGGFNHLETYESMGRVIPYIMENIQNVWNHQAGDYDRLMNNGFKWIWKRYYVWSYVYVIPVRQPYWDLTYVPTLRSNGMPTKKRQDVLILKCCLIPICWHSFNPVSVTDSLSFRALSSTNCSVGSFDRSLKISSFSW